MSDQDKPAKETKAIFGGESNKAIEPGQLSRPHYPNHQEEKKNLEIDNVRFQRRGDRSSDEEIQYELEIENVRFPHSIDVSDVRFSELNLKNPISSGKSSSERLIAKAIRGEYSYGKLGLVLGLASIIGGIIMGLNGVAGSTSWTAKLLGLESRINDAAPGVVLFIVGLFMVWATKPRVKMKDLRG